MTNSILEDKYLELNGIRIRYREAGKGANVLLVHGLGSYIEHWGETFPKLAGKYHVLALDLPGFGLSDKPDLPYSIPFLAGFVSDFMDARGIPNACLVGNSLGGMIAFELCISAPDRVNRMALVAGGCFDRSLGSSLRMLTLPFVNEDMLKSGREGSETFLKLLFADPELVTDEMVDMAYARMAMPGAAKAFLATLRSGGNILGMKRSLWQRTWRFADRIEVPVLLIWGRQDRILPLKHGKTAAHILPDARLHVFDPCGHMPQIERADEVNQLLLDFIGSVN